MTFNNTTDFLDITCEGLQDSIWVLCFFVTYINEVNHISKKLEFLIFADDKLF